MAEKLSYEYVYNYFKEQGCELLETEYINSKTKMKYICSCNNESEISFTKFKSGQKCKDCGFKKSSKIQSLNYEFVENVFKKNNCILLETSYINSKTKMKYICKCGNKSSINYSNFKNGNRCSKCSESEKHTYEYIFNYFKEQGCELLENNYINNKTKMKYICKCGNISEISWNNFKSNKNRCKECGIKKRALSQSGSKNKKWKENREEIYLLDRLRKSFSRNYCKKYMKSDPNYYDMLNNKNKYEVDHIIPISLFRDFVVEYNLNPEKIKNIINKRENLQLLTKEENMIKYKSGNLFEAAQYLMLNGIKFI